MGQYYTIINVTKKEYIAPHAMNDGAKLLEFGIGGGTTAGLCLLLANSNGRGGGDLDIDHSDAALYTPSSYDNGTYVPMQPTALGKILLAQIAAVAGRWAGDRIVIQGDYADKGDPSFISDARLAKFRNISAEVRAALSLDEYMRRHCFGEAA